MSKLTCLTLGNSTVYGLDHVGALTYLEERGILSEIKTIIASSSSAFIGLLLILGLKVSDIMTFCLELRRESSFNNLSLLREGQLMDINILKVKLFKIISEKISIIPTCQELYDITRINYTTVAYNINDGKTVYFNRKYTPTVNILDAVLASCSVQFLYGAYKLDGRYYVSGINSNPYPHATDDVIGIGICYDYTELIKASMSEDAAIIQKLAQFFIPIQELINKNIKVCKNYRHVRLFDLTYTGDLSTITKGYDAAATELSEKMTN